MRDLFTVARIAFTNVAPGSLEFNSVIRGLVRIAILSLIVVVCK